MRCPNCDREMVDTVSSSDAKGDTYGCPRCHTLFTIEREKYKEPDDSEITCDHEAGAEMLKASAGEE